MEGGAEEGGGAGPEEEGAGVGPEAEGAGARPEEGWRAPGSASAGGRFEVQQFAQEEDGAEPEEPHRKAREQEPHRKALRQAREHDPHRKA